MKELLKKGKIGKVALIAILLSLIIITAGCNLVQMNPEADKKQVVAKVEDQEITKQDFHYNLSLQKMLVKIQGQELPTEEEQLNQINTQFLDVIVGDEVLVYLAKEEDISVDEEIIDSQVGDIKISLTEGLGGQDVYQEFLEDNDITIEEFDEFLNKYAIKNQYVKGLSEKIIKDVSVSEDEVEKYYEENIRFFDPSTAKAKHILIDKENKELAEEIAQKAKDGEDFDKLMEEYGEKEEVLESADLGEFTKPEMVPEFSEAVFALEKGESSDLVETDFGFHVIKLLEKQEKPVQDFDEVKEQLSLQLEQQAQQEKFSAYLQEKEEELEIKKYPEKL